MLGTVLYGPGDVRYEERDEPKILKPTDAIIRIAATCVCGSDLWPYRGLQGDGTPQPMGHEYCGFVEEVGGEVRSVRKGQFVIGSFFASDNTCPIAITAIRRPARTASSSAAHKRHICAYRWLMGPWSGLRICHPMK